MGHTVSKERCVDLTQLPVDEYTKLINEQFTVMRTDKRIQTGWIIPAVRDTLPMRDENFYWAASHATRDFGGEASSDEWKVFMLRYVPDAESDAFVHGWRSCTVDGEHIFWPTRLETTEERDAWRANFRRLLDTLTPLNKQDDKALTRLAVIQGMKDEAAAEAAGTTTLAQAGPKYLNVHGPEATAAVSEMLRKLGGWQEPDTSWPGAWRCPLADQ
jgi:hypothetical protein